MTDFRHALAAVYHEDTLAAALAVVQALERFERRPCLGTFAALAFACDPCSDLLGWRQRFGLIGADDLALLRGLAGRLDAAHDWREGQSRRVRDLAWTDNQTVLRLHGLLAAGEPQEDRRHA